MSGYIHNIVIGCPRGFSDLPAFYCELLGMQVVRHDWIKIAKDKDSSPQLAFGDGWSDERPPRWPDPDFPQQLHLDVLVADLDATEKLVLGLGATPLQDKGAYRSYSDPVGHPFCLYRDESVDGPQLGRIVSDCPSPRALASFYSELLDMPRRVEDAPQRVVIGNEDGSFPTLGFQHAHYTAPRWPDPAYSAQVHLDLYFDDATNAREVAERLGAIPLPKGGSCPVYADPAAHPFCLCAPGQ